MPLASEYGHASLNLAMHHVKESTEKTRKMAPEMTPDDTNDTGGIEDRPATAPDLSATINELAVELDGASLSARLDEGLELARSCAELVAHGADPRPTVQPFTRALIRALGGCLGVVRAWPDVPDEVPRDVLRNVLRRDKGMSEPQALEAATAWGSIDRWVAAALVLLAPRSARDLLHSMPTARGDLYQAASAACDCVPSAMDLLLLLDTPDEEPLLVIHRGTGRGWRFVASGISDVFQLHTLLAHRLLGPATHGLIDDAGPPPTTTQIAAATTGRADIVTPAFFDLHDLRGDTIWNYATFVDIPREQANTITAGPNTETGADGDGERVIVLSPLSSPGYWDRGRSFPDMTPTLILTDQLSPAQVVERVGAIAPPQYEYEGQAGPADDSRDGPRVDAPADAQCDVQTYVQSYVQGEVRS